jgi:hypothetical protein
MEEWWFVVVVAAISAMLLDALVILDYRLLLSASSGIFGAHDGNLFSAIQ